MPKKLRLRPTDRKGLPLPNHKNWTKKDKEAVVDGIARGLLTREEAKQRYAMSEEELVGWEKRAKRNPNLLKVKNTRGLRH